MVSDPATKIGAPTLSEQYPALVLLVDDQAMIGEAVRRALVSEANIDFHYCGKPEDALALARQLKPTIILQDLIMPGVDGLDLVRQYRADPVTQEVPVIVLSTKEEAAVKAQAFAVGASDYMVKLPDKVELIARIQYHSRSYLNQVQRNDAYRMLRESEKRLTDRNFEIEVINEGLAREVRFRKQKSLEQSALASFSVAALASDDFAGTLRRAVASARNVIRADGGAIVHIDQFDKKISIVLEADKAPADFPTNLSAYPDTSILHYMLTTKKPVRSPDVRRDVRFTITGNFLALGMRGALFVPIPMSGGEIGIFALACMDAREFTDDEEEFLQSFANILAVFHAREKTLESLRLRDRALETITQGVTIRNAVADGSIIYTNPAFGAMTGYRHDEVIGRGPSTFLAAGVADPLASVQLEKDTIRRDVRGKRKNDTTFIDQITSSPILDPDGAVRYHVTVHEDVTESRKRDELLMEAKRMESVGQLTGGIAHDFNNLLMAIKANAEDIKEEVKADEMLHMQADIILEAADRGAGLVQQLMAFARKQELTPEPINVSALIAAYLPILRETLPETITIATECADVLPAVIADAEQLRTSIQNIVSNARDAMPGGGLIMIEARVATLDADYAAEHLEVRAGQYIRISITDSGTGMPKEMAQRAFVPFFTTKEVGKGTGLGLSMVHGFVKQSGGHAKLYSELGHGTTVKIYLPIADAIAVDETEAPSAIAAAGGLKILLVEDDDLVRQSVNGKLVRLGYAVTAVATAEGAVALLESPSNFDILLTDLVMPGTMDGPELIGHVRERWPQIGVVAASGYSEKAAMEKFDLPPSLYLLSKPYSTQELIQAISGAASSRNS